MRKLKLIHLFLIAGIFIQSQVSAQTLLHYWNFNTTTSHQAHLTPTVSNITGAAIDTFLFSGGSSLVEVAGGTGQGFDLNNYNARNGDAAGNHLRFNNPIYGALRFSLPATGYRNIIVKYASIRSGSGAYYQFIHYTTDGTNYVLFDTIEPTTTPTLYTLDFSSIAAVNNNPNFKVRITFGQGGGGTAGNNRIDNFTMEGSVNTPLSLVHYWNFNNTTSHAAHLTPSATNVTGAAIDTFLFSGGSSLVEVAGGTGQGFDLNNYNARNGDVAGNHLRFNNPIYGALRFSLPTTGYNDVIVKYASLRSGSGAYYQFVHYTTDGTNYILFDTIEPTTTATLYTLDFSDIPAADNNPNFKVRITFGQGGGGTAGNNRIDNFTLEGYAAGGGDVIVPAVVFSPLHNAENVAVNILPALTFNEDVRLISNAALNNNNVDTIVELRLNDSAGAAVSFNASVAGRVITITPSAALGNSQQYYVALKANMIEDLADNAITKVQSVKFKTIALQTILQPGDLVPVAYRMNANGADDEVSLLTLVDLLPGTIINFTDAKYTDNAVAQCPGGLLWTAPSAGVAAGTVISIKNDAGIASVGTLAGSNFGLSSGGDQFIVYTGTNTAPVYITALSSNNWLSANTTCSGSESKRPAGLADGSSSLQLSTAKGSVSGNTANAFYKGPQTGTIAQLRAAVLDTMNWEGTASGTAPQTWPVWTFPGPPVVLSAGVVNATTIRIVFNRDLDNATATNMVNFSGIAGLTSVVRSSNGAAADTLMLTYSSGFASGLSYNLNISGVKDNENRIMFAPYIFSFTYNTSIAFAGKFASVKEDTGSVTIRLNITNPSTSSVRLVVKGAPFSTAGSTDFTLATQTLSFTGATNSILNITVPVINDVLNEQDEYLVLSLEDPSGLSITGSTFFTVYIRDNDRLAPAAQKNVELKHVSSFEPNPAAGSTTEIVVYDSASRRLFMTSAIQDRLDIADFSNPSAITLIRSVNMAPYGGITSVAVKNGIVAVASPNANEQLNGSVVFFNTNGDSLKRVTVGALPDMITFTPDGKKVLTANEGQPNDSYTIDPEGSVSVIDLSGGIGTLTQAQVTTLDFTAFNAQETTLRNLGVRKLKLSSTLSQDFEPEYVTVSPDSKKAWATLQENNAIAEIDLSTLTITSVWPMGTKDFNAFGNGFDASDNSGFVHLSNYPVKAFYIPDAIANYTVGNNRYLITANEGDEKEYSGLNERTTVGAASTLLDSVKFPHRAWLKEDHNLGRFRMTNLFGDSDGDGDYDEIYCNGARSFTIWNADTKTKVYDSGDDFERITSSDPAIAAQFNADNEGNGMKSRSRAKGPEPEGLTIARIGGQQFAFIALERVGGVMVYNITDPNSVKFEDYKNNRGLSAYTGDHGPEGITYISPAQSPDGKAYITVANEISGTISVYEVKNNIPPSQAGFATAAANVTEGNAATVRIRILPAAQENGRIVIKALHGANLTSADYTATPALAGDSLVLDVNRGDTAASFSIHINDDAADEQNEQVTFEIKHAGPGMVPGPLNTFILTLLDNDTTIPARIVNFAVSGRQVTESAGSVSVTLNFDAPVQGSGRIVVKSSGSAVSPADYTTLPALSGDSILLNVSSGATTASFIIGVVNDTEVEADEEVMFTLSGASSNILIGSSKTFSFTIQDDDSVLNAVNDVRGSGHGVSMYPNPNAEGSLFFSEAVSIEVYDLTGKMMLAAKNTAELDIRTLPAGLYMIRLEGETRARKLIVE